MAMEKVELGHMFWIIISWKDPMITHFQFSGRGELTIFVFLFSPKFVYKIFMIWIYDVRHPSKASGALEE